MTTQINRFTVLILLLFCTLISCTKDDDPSLINASETADLRGGQQNGNRDRGGQRPQNGQQTDVISALDNTISQTWNNLFVKLDQYAKGMRPNATARAMAYINLAAYETAIPGMRNLASTSRLLRGLEIPNSPRGSIDFEVALNACYAEVLNHFLLHLPTNSRSEIAELEETLAEEYASNISTDLFSTSAEWGKEVAASIISYSQTDIEAEAQILEPQPTSYIPPTGAGYWTFSAEPERALFPYWEEVRTFVIAPEQTTSVEPLTYSSEPNSPYFQEMEEVQRSNDNARELDGEQLWIAEFWSDDVEGLMLSPPGRQQSIANQLIDLYGLNLEEALHLNLKLGFALNDAAVSAWKYKYQYMVMRPNVYIHEFIDPSFQTNLFRLIPWPNPTFPGYPSGHSTFASAAVGVFKDFVGNEVNFTDRTHEGRTEFKSAPRNYRSLDEMAEENAFSRIPLGVHLRMDCVEGFRLGYEISDAVNDFELRRRGI